MWPEGLRAYMVGIGGSGMSSLAAFLHESGASVSGSDSGSEKVLEELGRRGIRIHRPRDETELPPGDIDLLIHTAAVEDSDPRLDRARALGVEVLKYSQMLGRIMSRFKGVAVAGSHGKTSVTALAAHLLKNAGLSPSFVVGGDVPDLGGGGGRGTGSIFIAEACEYDRSFLNLTPLMGVITNLEPDHLDCYGTFARLIQAFEEFVDGIAGRGGYLILWEGAADLLRPSRFEGLSYSTYGFQESADLQVSGIRPYEGGAEFRLAWKKKELGRFFLRQPGRHNVLNAAAACLLALEWGAPVQAVREALSRFRGVRRRLEPKGVVNGVRIFSDYAHHPTEIEAVLDTLREQYPASRLVVAYQGHQMWRTGFFMDTMSEVLADFDLTLILETFSVREKVVLGLPGARKLCRRVSEKGGRSFFVGDLDEAPSAVVSHLKENDVLVLMGAGSIDEISGIVEKELSLLGKRTVERKDHGGHRGGDAALA